MDEKQLSKLIRLAEEGDMYLQEQIDEVSTKVDSLENKPEFSVDAQVEKTAMRLATKLAAMEKGEQGEQGPQGEPGPEGPQGERGERGFPGKDGKDGKDGRDGRDGADGRDGQDGAQGEKGDAGSPDTPDEIIAKINKSRLLINKDRIDGLVDALSQMVYSAVGITTTIFFKNGAQVGRAKNINFTGSAVSSVSVSGDTANVSLSGGAGGGQVNSVVAGTGISVDSSDPANPIVSATGGSFSIMVPTGTVDGVNKTFVFSSAPSVVVVDDGATMNKTRKDGQANWSGTSTVVMTVAPTGNIFGY